METLFLAAAGLGGALLACQFLAGLVGVGQGHDTDHDHDHDTEHGHAGAGTWFLGLVTFRSASAAVAFVGLGGLTALHYHLPPSQTVPTAALAGGGALVGVAEAMKAFRRLRHDGGVRLTAAVGAVGTVYLRVPVGGVGKVTVAVQNRTVECEATTDHPDDIPTGAGVRVAAVVGPNAVRVVPLQ